MHRVYGVAEPDAALVHTRGLYVSVYGAEPPSPDLWMGVATVPAATSISAALPSPQQTQAQPKQFAAVEDEDLDWLGLAVAKELPLKQALCKKAEPLRQIAIKDPSATVAEYKKFLRMMVDEKGAWVSTVPRPPLFLTTKHSLSVSRGEKISRTSPGRAPRRQGCARAGRNRCTCYRLASEALDF